jgi:hypothetical protein
MVVTLVMLVMLTLPMVAVGDWVWDCLVRVESIDR